MCGHDDNNDDDKQLSCQNKILYKSVNITKDHGHDGWS